MTDNIKHFTLENSERLSQEELDKLNGLFQEFLSIFLINDNVADELQHLKDMFLTAHGIYSGNGAIQAFNDEENTMSYKQELEELLIQAEGTLKGLTKYQEMFRPTVEQQIKEIKQAINEVKELEHNEQ